MSSQITLSQAVRSNLLSLQNTSSLLDTTQTRQSLSTKALSLASSSDQNVLRLLQ